MKKILYLLASAAILATPAIAADMPAKASAYRTAPAGFNWTGFYAGVQGGWAWGDSKHDFGGNSVTPDIDGGSIGGLVGYNWQYAPNGLFGIETDVAWSDISGRTPSPNPAFNSGTKIDWYGTTRARLGFVNQNWLWFVAGGVAYGDIERDDNNPGAGTRYRTLKTAWGWTIGGGVEVAFSTNWTARLEYLYVDLDSENFAAAVGSYRANSVDARFNVVRGAVNYRF